MTASKTSLIGSKQEGNATVWSCTISLINTMLGTGLLGMPWAIARCGLTVGLSLLVLGACVATMTVSMLATVVVQYPGASFKRLMSKTHLPPGLQCLPDVSILFMCIMGGQSSYLIVIGDAAQTVALYLLPAAAPIWHARRLWISVAMVPMLPMCLQKDLHSLRYASAMSLAATLFVAFCVLLRATSRPSQSINETIERSGDDVYWIAALNSIPVFIFGFTCHQQLPTLALELRERSAAKLSKAGTSAVLVVSCIYALIGIAGHYAFGSNVTSDVLLELRGSPEGALAAAALAFSLTTSVPLWTHAGRESAINLMRSSTAAPLTTFGFCCFTVLTVAPSFAIAMLLDDLGVALSLVGGTGCAITSLILPGLLYLRLLEPAQHESRKLLVAKAVVIVGFALVLKTVIGIIL